MPLSPDELGLPRRVETYLREFSLCDPQELRGRIAEHARPCALVTSRRVSTSPLRVKRWDKLMRRSPASPKLGPLASKFGGTPYAEEVEDWSGRFFLGQLDLSELGRLLDQAQLHGLLRIELSADSQVDPFSCSWFPQPSQDKFVDSGNARSWGKWEAELSLAKDWSYPAAKAWFDLLPECEEHEELWQTWNDANSGLDDEKRHRLLGCTSGGLEEAYNFTPPKGASAKLEDYQQILRLTFDHAAQFDWGTNWNYVLAPREDFERGDLSRIVVTSAKV